ncbi:hypothetical protein GOV06_03785 [Candidatus Woesearchaeota archaeon]|nr:hypothetical protein [Candidatus Woesearchaeota archaeon]
MKEVLDELARDISGVFDREWLEKAVEGNPKEVILYGSERAREVGDIVKEYLAEKYDVIDMDNQDIGDYNGSKTVLYVDLDNFPDVPERLRKVVGEKENLRILAVDTGEKHSHKTAFSYRVDVEKTLSYFQDK